MVYISSTAAGTPNPGQGFYVASKLAVEAIYKNLGLEFGQRGVTTVMLRPGYIDAGRGGEFLTQRKAEIEKRIPTRKILTATEVAETVLFLLSDSTLNINATIITMDGGLTAGKRK